MKHLSELLERRNQAEIAYVNAKTSLDNSNELVTCKSALKEARFEWLAACEEHILQHVLKENTENVQLLSNV